MIKVIDNFLPSSLAQDIKNLTMGGDMPWRYNPGASYVGDPDFYFMHNVFSGPYENEFEPRYSHLINDVRPILYFIEDRYRFVIDRLYRINCTLVVNQNIEKRQAWHTDFDLPHYVGIYYVNSCNGPTVIQVDGREEEIEFKENRFVLFDGSLVHCASLPTDQDVRVNIVFDMNGHFTE